MNVFTDGGCWGNPGKGGWAFILVIGDRQIAKNGAEPQTTNNRMELTAVIKALEEIMDASQPELAAQAATSGIDIHTDSQYVQKGITQWIHGWMRNGWKTANKDPVKNQDLWQELWETQSKLNLRWHWVKGHAGHPENEACDQLVQAAIANLA